MDAYNSDIRANRRLSANLKCSPVRSSFPQDFLIAHSTIAAVIVRLSLSGDI